MTVQGTTTTELLCECSNREEQLGLDGGYLWACRNNLKGLDFEKYSAAKLREPALA